jgi:hypothetical protein
MEKEYLEKLYNFSRKELEKEFLKYFSKNDFPLRDIRSNMIIKLYKRYIGENI